MTAPQPDGQPPTGSQPPADGQSAVGGAALAAEGALLQVEHVAKRFGAVTALSDINLHVNRGEVLGLLGDNGAGKSTLLKILCGFQPPDSGRILLDGQEVHLKSVDHARSLGIDVVYQDLALIDELTVYHNMFLKREKVIWPLLNNRAMRRIARERLDAIGIGLKSVDVPVARLSGGQRQAIEICDRINLLQHGEITFNKLSKDTSVQELNDIVIEEYRRALQERQKSA